MSDATRSSRFLGLTRVEWLAITISLVAILSIALIVFTQNIQTGTVDLRGKRSIDLTIKDAGVSTPTITISTGTTVTWTNEDNTRHSVMRDHDHSDHAHSPTTDDNVDPDVFSSSALDQGESYSYTFDTAETITYHDSLNPNIRGKIIVTQ